MGAKNPQPNSSRKSKILKWWPILALVITFLITGATSFVGYVRSQAQAEANSENTIKNIADNQAETDKKAEDNTESIEAVRKKTEELDKRQAVSETEIQIMSKQLDRIEDNTQETQKTLVDFLKEIQK